MLFEANKMNDWGKWIIVVGWRFDKINGKTPENGIITEVRCPECLEYFDLECFSKEEMNKCPNCGSIMRKDSEQE